MRWIRCAVILGRRFPICRAGRVSRLALLLAPMLLVGCVTTRPVGLRLPEPAVASCLVEQRPESGEAVGRYEFAPAFILRLQVLLANDQGREAAQEALRCASDVAKALREGVTAIRLSNMPP